MSSLLRVAASLLAHGVRLLFQHGPFQRGKGRLWDGMSLLIKRKPELFTSCIVRARAGYRMHVRFAEFHERNLFFWGTWTLNIEQVMRSVLRPGHTFVDVGANVGYFTLLGAQLVGPTGHVLAFEPSPSNRDQLRQNVALNGGDNIQVYEYALSDRPGVVDLFQPASDCTMTSMRPAVGAELKTEALRVSVPTIPLDALIPESQRQSIALIKLDIEGAEYLAVRGMTGLLDSRPGPDLICEVCDHYLQQLGSSAAELLAFLGELGYRAYIMRDAQLLELSAVHLSTHDLQASNCGTYQNIDVYFTRRPAI